MNDFKVATNKVKLELQKRNRERALIRYAGDPLPIKYVDKVFEYGKDIVTIAVFDTFCIACMGDVVKGVNIIIQDGGVKHASCPNTLPSRILKRPGKTKLTGRQYCAFCKAYNHVVGCKSYKRRK
jgi:hypothetical protein